MGKSNQALAEQPASNLPAVAEKRKIDEATWNALTTSVYPGAKPESVAMVWDYCKARNLDPLKKVVHIVPMKISTGKKNNKGWDIKENRDVIMPGIAELRTTAARTGDYAGQDDPVFGPEIEHMGVKAPEWCKVTVYRFVQKHRVDYSHTEYFTEACATKKEWANGQVTGESINSMWTKRPRGQLSKCAEAGALRKAFPEEIGNEYVPEEMHGKTIDMGNAEVVDEPNIEMPKAKSETANVELQKGTPTKVANSEKPPVESTATVESSSDSPLIGEGPKKILYAKIKNKDSIDEAIVCKQFGVDSINDLTMDILNKVLAWIDSQ